MENRKLFAIALFFLLAFSTLLLDEHSISARTSQTDSKLRQANNAVEQAFTAAYDAEKAGANITDLLARLNEAARILARAENSYRTGDFNAASAQADSVVPIAQEVTASAMDAKQTALASSQNTFWFNIAFTVIGIVVFVLALFLSWRWFKRRCVKNLYKAKPEVANQ